MIDATSPSIIGYIDRLRQTMTNDDMSIVGSEMRNRFLERMCIVDFLAEWAAELANVHSAILADNAKLRDALTSLSNIHDGNPSDARADTPPLDYARHMLWEARCLARAALEAMK